MGNLGQAQWLVNAALVASQWRALEMLAVKKLQFKLHILYIQFEKFGKD